MRSKGNAAALHRNTSGLILFDLSVSKGSNKHFSPHTTNSVLDLKLLNARYERQGLTFVQIRKGSAHKVAKNFTVPTLELSDRSQSSQAHLNYFGISAGSNIAAFVNGYIANLIPHSASLFISGVYAAHHADSKEYLEHRKIGTATPAKVWSTHGEDKKTHIQQFNSFLRPVEAMLETEPALAEDGSDAAAKQGPRGLAGIPHSTHVDFCLFGAYAISCTARASVSDDLWSAPAPAKWVSGLHECGPDLIQDLFC
ncbi:hypothetical protein K437DRAFT_273587 [Tilletiaria anomala UBC 951]|uniref:Uncharacterized protein n=1 Tax=Tilletiaria anomala (strain ATCC 24038 / CBS 436.72 / UBC 951) TaxID=1037660 RepID=A0A066W9H0_TILAU|nr:uncharacterized protein K437DRAFT_273587 [Tilletiaria anomala UBC 951]KDN47729.1 hypothetical protein K437DRAFT_273587 [Tilletiaria anomala UBC 951]